MKILITSCILQAKGQPGWGRGGSVNGYSHPSSLVRMMTMIWHCPWDYTVRNKQDRRKRMNKQSVSIDNRGMK